MSKAIGFILMSLMLFSCNQNLQFSITSVGAPPNSENSQQRPPSALDPIEKIQGVCQSDGSTVLLSCQNCPAVEVSEVHPPLSHKASELLEIMTLACQIKNKSDPSGYSPPTQEQILEQLNRCSTELYQDSLKTKAQESVVAGLLSDSSQLRQKMFGGLWYQPPYSDAFETYFGIEVKEARYWLCYQKQKPQGLLYDITYYQIPDRNQYKMPAAYQVANTYRAGLKSCSQLSVDNPWTPEPISPGKPCEYETVSGRWDVAIELQLQEWLANGWKVGAETANQCLSVDQFEGKWDFDDGAVTLAAYRCQ